MVKAIIWFDFFFSFILCLSHDGSFLISCIASSSFSTLSWASRKLKPKVILHIKGSNYQTKLFSSGVMKQLGPVV